MTCLCSQMFMAAESFMSPLYLSSCASCLRADRLLSRSRTFIRSTIDLRQSSFSFFCPARLVRTAPTSTDAAPVLAGAADGAGVAEAVAVAVGAAAGLAPAVGAAAGL